MTDITVIVFTARPAMAFLSVCLSVCPFVRLAATFRCFVETNEDTTMLFSVSGSTIILVSEEVKFIHEIREGVKVRSSAINQ